MCSGRAKSSVDAGHLAGAQLRVRQVRPGARPAARLPADPRRHRRVDAQQVELAVVGVRRGARRRDRRGTAPSSPARPRRATTTGGRRRAPRSRSCARRPRRARGRAAGAWRRRVNWSALPPATVRARSPPPSPIGGDLPAGRCASRRRCRAARRRWRTTVSSGGTRDAPRPTAHPGGSSSVARSASGTTIGSASGSTTGSTTRLVERLDGRRRGDDAAEQLLGGLLGRAAGRRHRGDERQLAEQVDQLLHRPHEVAAGQLLGLDDLGEALAGGPGEGDGDERRVGRRGAATARPPPRCPAARRSARRSAASAGGPSATSTTAPAARPGCGARRRTPRRARRGAPARDRRAGPGATTRRSAGRTRGTCGPGSCRRR